MPHIERHSVIPDLQPPFQVAYLGPAGTYSEEAAQRYFTHPDTQFTPSASLDEVVQSVERGEAELGVLPIENSTGGTIHRTLDLLLDAADLKISGEILLPIRHQLLTHATRFTDIASVGAHPQALAQCRKWLAQHLPDARQVATASNAAAAQAAETDPTYAAIASTQAAEQYKTPILAANIEDEPTNTTRFLVIGNQDTQPTGDDKTSIICGMPHVIGSLYSVLGALVEHDVNLTKIESRPITSKPWEYMFFIDMKGHAADAKVSAVLAELHKRTSSIRVLGSYATSTVGR